ncbi:MAG: hypothetical protein EAZ15_09610 [Sphingobacteriales bacterium]|nr:MAG: hypothetical protein EAZ15_09610 [Sphingobacteriales bacterium]
MRKILILIFVLLIAVAGVTWLYFKNISGVNNSSAKIFSLIPNNAALVFEYKNEASFYKIFKNFTLFKDVIGDTCFKQLSQLETVFIINPQISKGLNKSELYFSLHATTSNNANFLMLAPLNQTFLNENSTNYFTDLLHKNYGLKIGKYGKQNVFSIGLNNKVFNFYIYQNILVGSFDNSLLNNSIIYIENNNKPQSVLFETKTQRNKNAIANLYINFAQLPAFFNNFSKYKNPENTACLKNFKAYATLNINYQSNAFMFSGVTIADTTKKQYANLFLNQEPGRLNLTSILPVDAASYCAYFVSNSKKFHNNLQQYFKQQNIYQQLKNQINVISEKHAINIEKEFFKILGNDFGLVQLASGDKVGLISSNNSQRLSFLLSTISTQSQANFGRFDDANLLYYFFGDPFKIFKRPYYVVINNYIAVSNSRVALQNFVKQYNQQKLLNFSAKYVSFQQYLSNKGNIFYFYHNGNSKGILKSFLSNNAHQAFKSKAFNYQNIYGFSIQFSADKNRFFTNLYMNMVETKIKNVSLSDSLYLDSLNQQNIN